MPRTEYHPSDDPQLSRQRRDLRPPSGARKTWRTLSCSLMGGWPPPLAPSIGIDRPVATGPSCLAGVGWDLPPNSLPWERRFASPRGRPAAAARPGCGPGAACWCSARCTVRQTHPYGYPEQGQSRGNRAATGLQQYRLICRGDAGILVLPFSGDSQGEGAGLVGEVGVPVGAGWVAVGVFWTEEHQHQPGTWGTKHMPSVAGRPGEARSSQQASPRFWPGNRQIPALELEPHPAGGWSRGEAVLDGGPHHLACSSSSSYRYPFPRARDPRSRLG